jgi:hypothetical protein
VLACGCIYARPAAAAAAAAAQVNWPANIIARLKSLIPEPPIQLAPHPHLAPRRPVPIAASPPVCRWAAWLRGHTDYLRLLAASPPRRLAALPTAWSGEEAGLGLRGLGPL